MAYHSKYSGAEVDALLDKIKDNDVVSIDSSLSTTSENPVQNKVITGELNKKANKEYVDTQVKAVDDKVDDFTNAGYLYAGIATPDTNPGTPSQRIFYVAGQVGTYTNFSGITISDGELAFLYFDTEWHKTSISVNDANAVHFTPQTLTDEQKAQARQNIGATSTQIVNDLTTGGADKALSAEQGKTINSVLDIIESQLAIIANLTSHTRAVTYSEDNKVLFEANKPYTVKIQSQSTIGYSRLEVGFANNGSWNVRQNLTVDIVNERTLTITPTADCKQLMLYQSGGSNGIPITVTIPTGVSIKSETIEDIKEDIIRVESLANSHNEAISLLDIRDRIFQWETTSKIGENNYRGVQSNKIFDANKTYTIKIKSDSSLGQSNFEFAFQSQDSSGWMVRNRFGSTDMSVEQTFTLTPPQDVYNMFLYQSGGNTGIAINVKIYYGDKELGVLKPINDSILLNENNIQIDTYTAKAIAYKHNSNVLGIITAGQSNAQGRVPLSELPSEYSLPLVGCKFWYNNAFADYAESMLSSNKWAFDLITYYYILQTKSPFYVVKHTEGGASIDISGTGGGDTDGHWTADYEKISDINKRIILKLADKVYAGKSNLQDNVEIRAILWHQGEGDYYESVALRYYDNFKKVISFMRGLSGNPRCPFFFGTISHNSGQYSKIVEDAQLRIAAEDDNVYVVDMSKGTLLDAYHFDAASSIYLGKAIYNLMIDAGIINASKIDNPEPWQTI